MIEEDERSMEDLTVKGADMANIDTSALSNQYFIIPDVCKINLFTGEVELYIDDVSEAAWRFWEAVMHIGGNG